MTRKVGEIKSELTEKDRIRTLDKHTVIQNCMNTIISNHDVFLCYNRNDRDAVTDIATKLNKHGLKPWLDEWELRPGLPWQRELEDKIGSINSAAVFVGKDGTGPWQNMEIEAFLREFISRGCPVIPVILPNSPGTPDLPRFLIGMTWVDFRQQQPDPFNQLIWGITGKLDSSIGLEIVILEDIDAWEKERLANLMRAIASITKTTNLTIRKKEKGSTKLTFEFTWEQAEKLEIAVNNGDLDEFGVKKARMVELPPGIQNRTSHKIHGRIPVYLNVSSGTNIPMQTAEPSRPSIRINISRLPYSPEAQFLFREEQITEIDRALESNEIGVVGVIADGGLGKTALIWNWINRLDFSKHACSHIFAWSFYNRETDKTAYTSSEFFTSSFKEFGFSTEPGTISQDIERAQYLLDHIPPRTVLVLDGLESLQTLSGPTRGTIVNDKAMRHLLQASITNLGVQKSCLIVVTSRVSLADLSGRGYQQIDLMRLKPSQGAALLRKLGVTSDDPSELEDASNEVNGHCLSLVLLGKVMQRFKNHDITYRREIYNLAGEPSPEDRDRKHAERIMTYYGDVVAEPSDKIFLQMMGLLHRPMKGDQRDALARKAKFATEVRNFGPKEWSDVILRLKQYGLLIEDTNGDWDCHPLVREHFRDTLRTDKEKWQNAQQVLMNFFLDKNAIPFDRDGFEPFYRAVHHGCLAERFQDAFTIYDKHIVIDRGKGYSTNEWGLAADDVAALEMFFQPPQFIKPIDPNISAENLAFLWGRKAFCLTCLGRLDEAIHDRLIELEYFESHKNSQKVVLACEQLSALYVMSGKLREAKEQAEKALEVSNEHDCGWAEKERSLCRLGTVQYLTNELRECEKSFEEAKKIRQPLSSDYGIYYRLFKLDTATSDDDYEEIRKNAAEAFKEDESWLVPSGLDLLVQGIAIYRMGRTFSEARRLFNKARERLKRSGSVVYMPHYHLAEAEFDIIRGKLGPDDALMNVERARRIADSHGLQLFSIDCEVMETRIFLEMRNIENAKKKLSQLKNSCNRLWPRYYLREADVALLEGELLALQGNKNAIDLLSRARELIEKSGRKGTLLRRLERLSNML